MLHRIVNLLLLCCSIVGISESLKCYQCAYIEPSSGKVGLIDGFEIVPLEDSCKWGNKPNDNLLAECKVENEEEGYTYFYTCMQTKINGKFNERDGTFNGTLWNCGIGSIAQNQLKNSPEILGTNECQQGTLAVVTRDFKDPAGKQFLQRLSVPLNDLETTVKACACDVDGCWQRDDGEDTTTTTQGSGGGSRTTQHSAGVSITLAASPVYPTMIVITFLTTLYQTFFLWFNN